MDRATDIAVIDRVDVAVVIKVGANVWQILRFQRMLHGPGAGRRLHNCIRWVRRTEAADEVLFGQHVEVIGHRSEFRFLVEVRYGRGSVATGGDPQAPVLDALELIL